MELIIVGQSAAGTEWPFLLLDSGNVDAQQEVDL
jgi:hypothetical protein